MALPDISKLRIEQTNGPGPPKRMTGLVRPNIQLPPTEDRYVQKLKLYAKSLPYSIEPESAMTELLDFIILRLTQCVEARDFDVGLVQWDSMLTYWSMLKYPVPKAKRIALAHLYFNIAVLPGISMQTLAMVADGFKVLTRSKKKLSIEDLRLPWKPIYDTLSQDLFLSRRQFEYTQLSWCMGYMAENSRRFFHPAAINEMLSTFVPLMNGSNIDTLLASQYYLTTFLPLSHPQTYLPMLFRIWKSLNSYMYDERMLHFLSKLAELHVSPEESDPAKTSHIPDDERSEGEDRPDWSSPEEKNGPSWQGIYKDVGIFTEREWELLMCKVLASMEIPLADGGSLTTGPSTDSQVSFEINRLPKPGWRISSLAKIIVYSMAPDGVPAPSSNAPTPFFTPLPSSTNTPTIQNSTLTDYLSAPINKGNHGRPAYIAGCHALDSLAKLIASMESFFHPTNSGAWTTDLSAFVKYIVTDFNKRWHEEQLPDCKTPKHRRLTQAMRRELVKSLRTVTLLAMFSQDSATVSNIQSAMKSMVTMEPDLILHPILERAVPALETLTETQRTLAVIKALGAVAPALVSRQVYYPGAKYLVPILQLLVPGIDLNDPSKTLCTSGFLTEISQYIRFGDLTEYEQTAVTPMPVPTPGSTPGLSRPQRPKMTTLPSFDFTAEDGSLLEIKLTSQEEDAMLRDSTSDLPDWVANFIRRVILLLENLPEEGADGTAGGATEIQVVDAVTGACSQICAHLSETLYNLVLNIIFDYASTTVRPNAVRAIHQLVECVANADAKKTLDKFFDFSDRNIKIELENGASSIRTTQVSKPIPSDATLHWNLAILRGTVYNDGLALLKYKERFLSLLRLLHDKTYSKRGFSWTGKLLSSMLLTLTHTYPLENKFVNPSEWANPDFRRNHYRHWGKLYKANEVEISWHVPTQDEIDFALQVLRELVIPTLDKLKALVKSDAPRDAIWRNDFCRHLSLVRNAFSGIPTLCKEYISDDELQVGIETSDILNEIPEMIASLKPLQAGFCLQDPKDPRYQFVQGLRREFGQFLHEASQSLLSQGQENTVDAVQMLVRSIRTFFTDYADSRDSYFVNEEQYISERNVARQYVGQTEWPRSVWVRRARFYHSARLRWNAIERLRGPIQDALIDDVVQWCMWHYSVVRESAQSLLESICSLYDGVRRRALPVLYETLGPSTEDDDRIKGALWTLNCPSFGKYAVSEQTLAPEFMEKLFGCQAHEKPSIQDMVSTLSENCKSLSSLFPLTIDLRSSSALDHAIESVKALLPASASAEETAVMSRCTQQTKARIALNNKSLANMTSVALKTGSSSKTHWKYAITATRMLRTLVRRDVAPSAAHVRYFLENTHNNHSSITFKRYYSQRALMKTARNIKHVTFCKTVADLIIGRSANPLREKLPVVPSHEFTQKVLSDYQIPHDPHKHDRRPFFHDKDPAGWLAWPSSIALYKPPHESHFTFQPWSDDCQEALFAIEAFALDPDYWTKLSSRYSEENHETSISLDHASCIKSIFQLFNDRPLAIVKPVVEKLLENKKPDSQRAAAEFLAGILNGSKHWPGIQQKKMWQWILPMIPNILGRDIKTDTLRIWTSFVEYMFHAKDPRRLQPLFDFLLDQFKNLDYHSEMAFDVTKSLNLFRGFYEEMSWKFCAYADWTLEHCWREISNHHDDVRGYVGEILAFLDKIKWQPRPSSPQTEVFVRECRTLPSESDIMELRGVFHRDRINELAQDFERWRKERVPGARAFQSTYDRVGVTVCKWLFQSLHDIHAGSVYDYILPLVPELLRFTELNDNDDLAKRASSLLVRMCGVIPPRSCVNSMLDAIFAAIQNSSSWRVRLKALPLLQVFYFRLVPLISELKMVQILEVLCQCLDDEVVEVREMAATTLSGILRLSPRRSIITLKDRFVRLAKATRIPARKADPTFNRAIRQRHAAVLGICALIDSYPYTIEKWMPQLLTETLAEMTYDPIPISTTVRKCASNFKKTHQDSWHEDSKKFNEEQLTALSTLLTGSSYYA